MSALQVLMLLVNELVPNLSQPRKSFDPEELARMTASVAARGILQPIRVRRNSRGCWEIVTGECRWRAAKEAGLERVPCLPLEGELDEVDLLADQIIENEIRNSLRPLDLARSLAKLKALKGCNSQTLAKELGLSSSRITLSESLLTLPVEVQELVDDGRLPESTAYHVSRLTGADAQREMALLVASKKLNRNQAQEAVNEALGKAEQSVKGNRLSCRLKGGVSISVAKKAQPLTKADLQAGIDWLRSEMTKLAKDSDTPNVARAS
jgi:ParB family transcriptional regulator, chromosome partitioning protein